MKKDKLKKKYAKQRKKRGFDDFEIENFNVSIAKYILSRLLRYRKFEKKFKPTILFDDDWNVILDKIQNAFKLIVHSDIQKRFDFDENILRNNKKQEELEEGLNLFREWFMYL